MILSKELKHILLYGLILAILIIVLKWLQWNFFMVENTFEIYVGLVAVFFTALGGWLASQFLRPKVKTIVIEREVPERFLINQFELDKLNLSTREFEVLQLLAKGYSNADISEAIFLSISTVKTHVSNLFAKMEVKSRTQAIEKAKRLRIIS